MIELFFLVIFLFIFFVFIFIKLYTYVRCSITLEQRQRYVLRLNSEVMRLASYVSCLHYPGDVYITIVHVIK